MANFLAYYDMATITAVKSFMSSTLGKIRVAVKFMAASNALAYYAKVHLEAVQDWQSR